MSASSWSTSGHKARELHACQQQAPCATAKALLSRFLPRQKWRGLTESSNHSWIEPLCKGIAPRHWSKALVNGTAHAPGGSIPACGTLGTLPKLPSAAPCKESQTSTTRALCPGLQGADGSCSGGVWCKLCNHGCSERSLDIA